MKNKLYFIGVGITIMLLSSCASHYINLKNQYNHTTEVVLSRNNFTVIKTVQGEAQASYVFGFGGLKKQAIIGLAREKMLQQADLEGKSRTVANEIIDVKSSIFPFVTKTKVTISAQVIEFTE